MSSTNSVSGSDATSAVVPDAAPEPTAEPSDAAVESARCSCCGVAGVAELSGRPLGWARVEVDDVARLACSQECLDLVVVALVTATAMPLHSELAR